MKVGDRIACPACNYLIGYLKSVPKDIIKATDIDFAVDGYKKKSEMKCYKCNAIWGINRPQSKLLKKKSHSFHLHINNDSFVHQPKD